MNNPGKNYFKKKKRKLRIKQLFAAGFIVILFSGAISMVKYLNAPPTEVMPPIVEIENKPVQEDEEFGDEDGRLEEISTRKGTLTKLNFEYKQEFNCILNSLPRDNYVLSGKVKNFLLLLEGIQSEENQNEIKRRRENLIQDLESENVSLNNCI